MKEEILKELRQEQKKSIRRTTILIVALGIIFGSIAGVTAYTISAKEIGYSPKDSSWKVNNVADAIESLKTLKGGSTNYSLDEQVVGTWIDGKPLYQKTIDCGKGLNNNLKTIAHGILNIDTIIRTDGLDIHEDSNRTGGSLPWVDRTSFLVGLWADSTNIYIRSTYDASSTQYYCTIQYTKTTDNATNS